jgi:hypothetical protein
VTLNDFWNTLQTEVRSSEESGIPILFRGESRDCFKMTPSLGRKRDGPTHLDISFLEDQLMRDFKRMAAPLVKAVPRSEWEWLFLAQHYGLPTRLLDWTTNPMVALFFATLRDDSSDNDDAVIHVVTGRIYDEYERINYKSPEPNFDLDPVTRAFANLSPSGHEFVFVRPSYTDERYLNQKSVFCCMANPEIDLDIPWARNWKIKKEWKKSIRETLRVFGTSESYIYPGLGSIAEEIRARYFDNRAALEEDARMFRRPPDWPPDFP